MLLQSGTSGETAVYVVARLSSHVFTVATLSHGCCGHRHMPTPSMAACPGCGTRSGTHATQRLDPLTRNPRLKQALCKDLDDRLLELENSLPRVTESHLAGVDRNKNWTLRESSVFSAQSSRKVAKQWQHVFGMFVFLLVYFDMFFHTSPPRCHIRTTSAVAGLASSLVGMRPSGRVGMSGTQAENFYCWQ